MIKKILRFYKKKFWTCERYAKSLGVTIGNDCSIATRYFGTEPYLIEIGNNVQITSDVKFFNHGGAWVLRLKYPDCDFFGKIKIKNNVYIGSNSLIMPGVTIGNNVIVGAGTIVTKSIPDGKICVGNPGKVIGDVDDFAHRIQEYDIKSKGKSYEAKKALLLSLTDNKFLKK